VLLDGENFNSVAYYIFHGLVRRNEFYCAVRSAPFRIDT